MKLLKLARCKKVWYEDWEGEVKTLENREKKMKLGKPVRDALGRKEVE